MKTYSIPHNFRPKLFCRIVGPGLVNIAALLTLALTTTSSLAAVPTLINYQGQLLNPDGTPMATADYALTFRIYDAPGAGGNLVWGPQVLDGESGPGYGPKIPVVQGYFNVMLGPVDTHLVSLAGAFEATNRFVEIQVGTNNPISPRQQVLSAPYAFRAANADKLAGFDWSALLLSGANSNNPVAGQIDGSKLGPGSVPGSRLANASITASQIAPGAVTAAAIANGTIGTQLIANGAVTGLQIANGAIGAQQLTQGGIQTSNLGGAIVTLTNLAPRPVGPNVGIGGVARSSSTGIDNSGGLYNMTNLVVSIVTTGRPVFVGLIPDGSTNYSNSYFQVSNVGGFGAALGLGLIRNQAVISTFYVQASTASISVPPGAVHTVDFPQAGTQIYTLRGLGGSPDQNVYLNGCVLIAFEL